MATTAEQITTAQKLARRFKECRHVVEIDHCDDRIPIIVNDDYLNDPEFEAFDGELIASCYSSGDIEFFARRGEEDKSRSAYSACAQSGM